MPDLVIRGDAHDIAIQDGKIIGDSTAASREPLKRSTPADCTCFRA